MTRAALALILPIAAASMINGGVAEAAAPQWRVVPGTTLGPHGSGLVEVAATGPGDAWAVGYACTVEKHVPCPAIARWNGVQWKNATMPAYRYPAGYDSDIYTFDAVSAASGNDVWVVGNGRSVRVGHWNGGSWSMYRPFGVAENYQLSDVEVARGRVWFAGTTNDDRGIILSWNGRTGFTSESIHNGTLAAVSARSRTGEIWAVGHSTDGPLVVRGTGKAGAMGWSEISVPRTPEGALTQVWPISAADVWAIGHIGAGRDLASAKPLMLHFDGRSWTRVPLPVKKGRLTGITADASGDIWVTGIDASHPKQALFLRQPRGRWTTTYGPDFRFGEVRAVSITRIPGSNGMWAVGRNGDGDGGMDREKTSILRYG
ncbi:hypothetical protein [Microtetraspora malaysiensis]|uniref:Uncharacterized protein n=1 Tax=Microtetraspora malaysiensis TaxID=161358 RepID=A0ABW6SPT4_9ACTN